MKKDIKYKKIKFLDENNNEVMEHNIDEQIITDVINKVRNDDLTRANDKIKGLSYSLNNKRAKSKKLREKKGFFMFVFLEWLEKVSKDDLSKSEMKVLLYILSKAEKESNEFKEKHAIIAKNINLDRVTVTNALSKLVKKGYLSRVETEDNYYFIFNKDIGWNGSLDFAYDLYIGNEEEELREDLRKM